MRFWDASAIVPLIVGEDISPAVRAVHGQDLEILVWWATEVECVSAISRRERSGSISGVTVTTSLERLEGLVSAWTEVDPSSSIRRTARRLLRTHDLRVGDAFQLAAALQGAEGDPSSLRFVSRDERLNEAASREGFVVIDPGTV